jgi:L-threonylcarbamoyladenylate synthase
MFTWNVRMIDSEVKKAAEIISAGGIILYPTDTIWGIGCDATNPDAVQKIYEIKQRADNKSMLVLMSDIKMLGRYLQEIPPKALELINSASKPTTIIYPEAINLATNMVAEDGSVGIRITSDDFCKKLIELTDLPIVSTSANISGNPSPDTFSSIEDNILDQMDHIVKWRQDEKTPSAPSTIIRIDKKGRSAILRS